MSVFAKRTRCPNVVATVPAVNDSTTAAYMHRAVVFSRRRNGAMGDAMATYWLCEASTNIGMEIPVWRILDAEPSVVEFSPMEGVHARGLSSRRCNWANAHEASDMNSQPSRNM